MMTHWRNALSATGKRAEQFQPKGNASHSLKSEVRMRRSANFTSNVSGFVLGRDVNAARNILQRGMSPAAWEIGSLSHPGVSGSVGNSDVAGLPGQDTEQYAADSVQSGI